MQAEGGDSSLAGAHKHGSRPLPVVPEGAEWAAADAGSAEELVADASRPSAAATTTVQLAAEDATPEVSHQVFTARQHWLFGVLLLQCMFKCPVLTHPGGRHQCRAGSKLRWE